MPTMSVEEAAARLPELIAKLIPGQEIVLTVNDRTVAKVIATPTDRPVPVPGRGRGKLIVLVEDDSHLEGFEEYMS